MKHTATPKATPKAMKHEVTPRVYNFVVGVISWLLWPLGLANGNREYNITDKIL